MTETSIEWTVLCGRRLGVLKTAAHRLGLSFDEYRAHLDAGHRWCTACRLWHPIADFDRDSSRGLGLKSVCKNVARERNRITRHRRDPVKQKARLAVALAVRLGRLPRANSVPCTDCGRTWTTGDLRHEYDHFKGYAPEHHLAVEAVCTKCHRSRESVRGKH